MGKNTTKTCALLRVLWKGSFPLIQNCHATQGSLGGWLVEQQPQAGLQWICWGSNWTNPKELLFLGYLGGRKEQPQPAADAVGLQGCHLQNSHNELLPTSHHSRSSSTPGAAPTKSELPKITNQFRELHAAFPSWDGPADGCRISQGHLQSSQKEN